MWLVFPLITSAHGGERGLIFPSYETLLYDIMRDLEALLNRTNKAGLEQIALIAQQKQAGINGRLQALSLASGTLALLGLAALVVAQDKIANGIDQVVSQYFLLFEDSTENIPSGVTLLLFGLALLVLGVAWYVLRTYRELRLLEIINVACALRLAALAAPAASSAAIPKPITTLSPTTTRSQLLLLLAWLGGLALVGGWLSRRKP